jgi:hypothetical protein
VKTLSSEMVEYIGARIIRLNQAEELDTRPDCRKSSIPANPVESAQPYGPSAATGSMSAVFPPTTCPRSSSSRRILVTMFTAYNDESGHPEQSAVVVAGLLASDNQWKQFERNWRDTLQEFGITRFHANEFFHSVGEFRTWADHKKNPAASEARQRFLRSLISHMKLRVQLSYSHTVRMADYRKVNEIYFLQAIRPYELVGRTAVKTIAEWAGRNRIPENRIKHVFEDGPKHKGFLESRIKKDKGFEPTFKRKEEAIPLQAADLLAYETRLAIRDIFERGVTDFEDLRYPLRMLEQIPHQMEDWGTYTLDRLQEFCVNVGIPRRDAFTEKDFEGMSHDEIVAEIRRRMREERATREMQQERENFGL